MRLNAVSGGKSALYGSTSFLRKVMKMLCELFKCPSNCSVMMCHMSISIVNKQL